MPIQRTFRDIPEGKLSESDHQSYLVNLGWSSGTGWEEILGSKRVLIVSEAGAGKTHECREQQKRLWNEGEPAFYLELTRLASVPDLKLLLGFSGDGGDEEARFDAWLSSQHETATFFLDSIDELKLSLRSFEEALNRLRKGIKGQLDRVRIVVTTRPIPFDEQLIRRLLPLPERQEFEFNADSFAEIAMGRRQEKQWPEKEDKTPGWRTVALMPLSDIQIADFARGQGVNDPAAMLSDLKRRNAEEFARRPQDLIELCADWRDFKRIRTHNDQVASNVRIKLKPREDRAEPAELSVEKAIDGAARLALAMMLTRRLTIRHSAEADTGNEDIALDPATILSDWSAPEQKALLERPLFGFASYGRVRFHHRSVVEYLASERLRLLRAKGMTVRALKRLLFAATRGKTIARPSKRPIAGWLALTEPMVYETLRDHEPAVLMTEGDPESLTVSQRCQALRSYVDRYGQGGWRGLSIPSIQIHRFAAPEFGPEIIRLWSHGIENPEVRELLLNIIEIGRIAECSEIAHDIAISSKSPTGERLAAIEALAALDDARLDSLIVGIVDNATQWPDKIARRVVVRLYPQHLSIVRLCQILARVKESKGLVGELSWQLPELIAISELNLAELEALRDGLLDLMSDGLQWQNDWSPLVCDRYHLSNSLVATCILGLKGVVTDNWLYASILALRLLHNEDGNNESITQLKKLLADLPAAENARLFWIEDALMQSLHPVIEPWNRYSRIEFGGATQIDRDRDWMWIEADLSDTARAFDDRAMLLKVALGLAPSQELWRDHVMGLKQLVADQPELVSRIDDCLKPSTPDNQESEWQMKAANRKEESERRDAKNHASWVQFWQEVAEKPDAAFSHERSGNTAWNLWRAMRNIGGNNRTSDWNRGLIEQHFGKAIADRLRLTLMDLWRNDRPTFESERPDDAKHTFLERWQLGLAAIYAEAEDPLWAARLSETEAQLAARYVPMELNSFPSWMESLANAHPAAVDATLGNELTLELEGVAGPQWHSMLLQNISHSPEVVIALFLPRLRDWLRSRCNRLDKIEDSKTDLPRFRQVLDVLMKHGDDEMGAELHAVAQRIFSEGSLAPFAGVWLPVLIRLDANAGAIALEELIRPVEPGKRSKAVIVFANLFGDRHDGINLADPQFTPAILLRLMRLAYYHVRPSDDAKHEGSYTPDERDDAERARNEIVNALLRAKGEEGWTAKLEMASDPLCAHFKDRILAMAEEQWAEEIDVAAFDDAQAVALDKTGEAPPSTNEAMFALMVDRLDDISELLLRDITPRDEWASITEEKVMRRAIARELTYHSNGLYTVDQEAVTADEKETDIRLRSNASPHEAVIELKLADKNRTAKELMETISVQLVTKYMAAENSRSGCLLLTLAMDRSWNHPDDGTSINFSELVALLREEAERIVKSLGGSSRIHIHPLDLRPRLQPETKRKKANVARKRSKR